MSLNNNNLNNLFYICSTKQYFIKTHILFQIITSFLFIILIFARAIQYGKIRGLTLT